MSTSAVLPHSSRPGRSRCPGFCASNAMVNAARTLPAAASPVAAFTPLAMSREIFGALQAFMAEAASSKGGRNSPEKPVPKRASMMKSAPPINSSTLFLSAAKSRRVIPASKMQLYIYFASSVRGTPPQSTTMTLVPSSKSFRATTKPSPPLFPLPQKIIKFLPTMLCRRLRIYEAAAQPAFSISR